MKMPRYDDVPVFGQDILVPRRQAAQYGGLFRCLGFVMLVLLLFVGSIACVFTGLYLVYPLDPPEATNILVLGVDTRANSGEGPEIGRTDAIMIVRIDPQREQISVLSIPRDLYINAPGFGRLRANTVVRNAELQEADTGISVMQESIENTFNIQIDHTVRIDFAAFVDTVDAIGGIEITVPYRIEDTRYPLPDDSGVKTVIFEPGLQWMDGERALEYTRTRQADSDYARAARQQQVIEAIFFKLNSPRGLLRAPAVLTTLDNNTETTLGLAEFYAYFPAILHYGPDGLKTQVITPEYMIDEGGINLPNLTLLDPWLNEHMRPEPTQPTAAQ